MSGRGSAIATVIVLGSVINGCDKPAPTKLTAIDPPQAKALRRKDIQQCVQHWQATGDGSYYGTNDKLACAHNAEDGSLILLGLDDGKTPVLLVRMKAGGMAIAECPTASGIPCHPADATKPAVVKTRQALQYQRLP